MVKSTSSLRFTNGGTDPRERQGCPTTNLRTVVGESKTPRISNGDPRKGVGNPRREKKDSLLSYVSGR